ncbi:MAG: hypothetical protein HKL99_12730 [Burkholderiales bacterium]|nr:hypothetical protein [Burkholderiales bacterium]
MNQELNTTCPAYDASAIGDLLAASIAALQAAIQTDLPPMTTLLPVPGATRDLPQGVRRDLHAAENLYGVRFGPVHAVTRRPTIKDTRTFVVPQHGGPAIVVLAVTGAAAIYKPNGRRATLAGMIPCVTKDDLEAWAREPAIMLLAKGDVQ